MQWIRWKISSYHWYMHVQGLGLISAQMCLLGILTACAPVCTGLYWLVWRFWHHWIHVLRPGRDILSGNYSLAATKLRASLILCLMMVVKSYRHMQLHSRYISPQSDQSTRWSLKFREKQESCTKWQVYKLKPCIIQCFILAQVSPWQSTMCDRIKQLIGPGNLKADIQRSVLPYSRKFWRGIKFGCLAVCIYNCQTKICQYFLLTYIRTAILYRTTKFKSVSIFAVAILSPTAKFNSHQYFWLYGITCLLIWCSIGSGMFQLVSSPQKSFFLTEVFLEGIFLWICWPHILNKIPFFNIIWPIPVDCLNLIAFIVNIFVHSLVCYILP